MTQAIDAQLDAGNLVTFKTLAYDLSIPFDQAKRDLETYAKQANNSSLYVLYLLAGKEQDAKKGKESESRSPISKTHSV